MSCDYCDIPSDDPVIEIGNELFNADIRLLWIVAKMYHEKNKIPQYYCNFGDPEYRREEIEALRKKVAEKNKPAPTLGDYFEVLA